MITFVPVYDNIEVIPLVAALLLFETLVGACSARYSWVMFSCRKGVGMTVTSE